ncbi:hypothetical protein HDU85_006871, partial [Gaertneriomyces sp. JEL0708]
MHVNKKVIAVFASINAVTMPALAQASDPSAGNSRIAEQLPCESSAIALPNVGSQLCPGATSLLDEIKCLCPSMAVFQKNLAKCSEYNNSRFPADRLNKMAEVLNNLQATCNQEDFTKAAELWNEIADIRSQLTMYNGAGEAGTSHANGA